jgi:hypothetical protein
VARDGKPTKVPIDPHTGRKARTNDAATWGTFGQALARAQRDRLAGVGFVFTSDDPYFGGDLDSCLNPATGELDPRAADILAKFNATYAELSPSGNGVKFIGRGKLPGDSETQRHKRTYPDGFAVELYDAGRFFALTGRVWADHPRTITDCQAALTELYDALFGEDIRKAKAAAEVAKKAIGATNDDDAEVVRSLEAMIGDDFTRLYRDGDISGSDNDRSKADYKLAKQFIWRVGPDAARVEGLMRGSALVREKWDRNAGAGVTYLRRTIAKAIARTTRYYTPRRRSRFILRATGASPPVGGDGASEPPAAGGYRFAPITSAAFDAGNYELRWLVKRLLVAGQPFVIGGPQKALKTNLAIDLALSLGTGLPFLGYFDVYRRVRVAFLSGETGEYTLRETARNVCAAKGVRLADAGDMVLWDFDLPQLSRPDHVAELAAGLARAAVGVLFVDPMYLCLLSGGTTRAENLFETGPLLRAIALACRQAGTTLGVLHHANRRIEKFKPMELSDLAYSGIAEWVRQWLLVNHRQPFAPETGSSRLWLSAGGSAGQGGLWTVDVEEGRINDEFGGRTWKVTVNPAGDVRLHDKDEKKRSTTAERVQQHQDDEAEVLRILDEKDKEERGFGVERLIQHATISGNRVKAAITRLVSQEVLRRQEVDVMIGSGATKKAAGVVRTRDKEEIF